MLRQRLLERLRRHPGLVRSPRALEAIRLRPDIRRESGLERIGLDPPLRERSQHGQRTREAAPLHLKVGLAMPRTPQLPPRVLPGEKGPEATEKAAGASLNGANRGVAPVGLAPRCFR